jgi:hypothetical protein
MSGQCAEGGHPGRSGWGLPGGILSGSQFLHSIRSFLNPAPILSERTESHSTRRNAPQDHRAEGRARDVRSDTRRFHETARAARCRNAAIVHRTEPRLPASQSQQDSPSIPSLEHDVWHMKTAQHSCCRARTSPLRPDRTRIVRRSSNADHPSVAPLPPEDPIAAVARTSREAQIHLCGALFPGVDCFVVSPARRVPDSGRRPGSKIRGASGGPARSAVLGRAGDAQSIPAESDCPPGKRQRHNGEAADRDAERDWTATGQPIKRRVVCNSGRLRICSSRETKTGSRR